MPDLDPMAVTESLGVGGRLVVAGAGCARPEQAGPECDGQGLLRVLTDDKWQTFSFEPQPGNVQQNAVSIMGPGGSPDTVWLKVAWPEQGKNDGRIRAVLFDLRSMRIDQWTGPSPGLGASCLIDGRVVDYSQSRTLPPAVPAGQEPGVNDPIPITYQVFMLDPSQGWAAVANGGWTGLRPRIDNIHCTPSGLSTSLPGTDEPTLGWTMDRGWFEAPPDREIAESGSVPVGNLPSGQQIASIRGNSFVERAPGEWQLLPAPARADSVPILALNNDFAAFCGLDSQALTLSACRVVQLRR